MKKSDTRLHSRIYTLHQLGQLLGAPLRNVPKPDTLDTTELRFAEALKTAVLHHLGQTDALIQAFMPRPYAPQSLDRQILRLGLTQLLFLEGVAAFAAVDTTVELARTVKLEAATGTLNAILRRAQAEGAAWLAKHQPQQGSCAPWLAEALKQDYGKKAVPALLNGLCQHATLDVVLLKPELAEHYASIAKPIAATTNGWRITTPQLNVTDLPGWAEGGVYAQNGAAQLPAQLLGYLLKAEAPNQPCHVLDVCAAPGGKSIQLHQLLPHARITSVDNNPKRLERMAENFTRCGLSHKLIQQADATALPFEANSADAILLDAPCSATGTARKTPEVLWNKTPEQVAELVELQRQMLTEATRVLKPGGLLAYATCSLLKDESERQALWAQKQLGLSLVPLSAHMLNGEPDFINGQGTLRCLPQQGVDGFFCALFRKI